MIAIYLDIFLRTDGDVQQKQAARWKRENWRTVDVLQAGWPTRQELPRTDKMHSYLYSRITVPILTYLWTGPPGCTEAGRWCPRGLLVGAPKLANNTRSVTANMARLQRMQVLCPCLYCYNPSMPLFNTFCPQADWTRRRLGTPLLSNGNNGRII